MTRCLASLIAPAIILAGSRAAADTIHVPVGGDIQKAINMSATGDVIQLDAGVYQPNYTLDTIGRAITIRGAVDEQDAPMSRIDGRASIRVLQCVSGEDSTTILENLVLTNGRSEDGAGMYCQGSSPMLVNCTFTDNIALNESDGGALHNTQGSPTLTECKFTRNVARFGGAVYCTGGTPVLTDCIFRSNIATDHGGGMYNDASDPTLSGCTFWDNTATERGGGVCNGGGSNPTMTDCTFSENSSLASDATHGGGGMFNDGSDPELIDCTFTDNTAVGFGGGMKNDGSSPILTDCTFAGNTAEIGGAIRNLDSGPVLTGCSIVGNVAGENAGGMSCSGGDTTLAGTTVCSNTPNQIQGFWEDLGANCVSMSCDDCLNCPDADDDGVCDGLDQCPGEPDIDSDGDGVPDCIDDCPTDPQKTGPGRCGCNRIDTDVAGDYDCDGDFDLDDYAAMGIDLGVCPGDMNGDGLVDGEDLTIVLGAWGVCP